MAMCAHDAHKLVHTLHVLSPRIPKYFAEDNQHDLSQCCLFITSDSCKVVPGDSLPMPNEVPIRKNFDQHLNDHGNM